ncbi:cuticular protein RR-1 motif 47 isoform X1 [Bombyx mori]|uniref:Cuticle protein n=1 Tax=Bombyx mori TaxID=7091 RepID=A0A8R2GAY4_BOMMO|nr:cuticular protein RR-1 motif 47 isoform X1 [Bombyx mori]
MSWSSGSVYFVCFCALVRTQVIPGKSRANDGDYNTVNTDGSFDFGYANKDRGSSYHLAHGTANGVVGGRFGGKDPATDTVKETIYTAGPRGFRAKGPNVHRQLDLDQRPRGPIGNKDDPFFDPNEDPSYAFNFDTRTYSKNENADSRGDVKGHYSYVDDIGERHDVSYIAGRDTGFHVSSAHPDNPGVIGSPFHRAPLVRGETKARGRTAVQRGLDGSYRFISAGPDQRRTESSDSQGNVRGSYTFLDDKGVQRTVNYIAGPGIGYRIIKNNKDAIPSYFPTLPSPYDPTFTNAAPGGYSPPAAPAGDSDSDDVFKGPEGTAASGHVKPPPFQVSESEIPEGPAGPITSAETDNAPNLQTDGGYSQPAFSQSGNEDLGYVDEDAGYGGSKPTKGPGKPARPTNKPYRPQKKPYVPLKPTQTTYIDDSDYPVDTDKNKPSFGVGYNIDSPVRRTTIIRNIGDSYFDIPPGVSVRAHVQSIDLYPFGAKPVSPSEALESEKT